MSSPTSKEQFAPVDEPGGRTGGRKVAQLFPGERRVWQIAGVVLALALIGIAVALLRPHEDLLGSNSVGARTDAAIVPAHVPLCVPRLRVPPGTGQVRFDLDTRGGPRPALKVAIRELNGTVVEGASPPSAAGGHHVYTMPVPTVKTRGEYVVANVCLTAGSEVIAWGAATPQGNLPSPTVGGKPVNNRVSVWFLGRPGQSRSIASQIGAMFRRASLFRPGFVGPWTYWVLFLVLLPLLGYASVRLLANAERGTRRRVPLPLLVGLVAFGVAACWAVVTPAFESPDESEHFAYVQYFAETGKAVDTSPTARPVYSDAEGVALEAVYHTSVIERADARPPWFAGNERQYWHEVHSYSGPGPLPRDNGGGFHPAISVHTPAYYSLLAPAYLLTRNQSVFAQLFAMRLISALMGALAAIMAVLIVGELLPGRRALAVAAGLIVAFEPMFGFISGAVNNDNGVNAAAAVLIYLLVRALRRGLSLPLALGLGVTLVVTPLLKGTGYELYLPAALALLFAIVRRHRPSNLIALGALVATVVVLQFGWSQLATVFHHTTFTTPGGGTPGSSLEAFHKPKTYLSWMIRLMLPFSPPFIHHNWTIVHWPFFDIYIERGFGSFGWYAIEFPKWVYAVIVAALAGAAALGVRFLWQERGVFRRRWPEVAFLVLVPVTVIGAVEANFEPPLGILPIDGTPEQGRYVFPAIVALVALFIGAAHGLGRRRAGLVAAGAVCSLIALTFASQLMTLSAFYT